MALERNGPAGAASDEGEDKGLLRTARVQLEEGPGGWSVDAAFSDLEMQELGVTPPHPPAGHPPVAVALEAGASDLGDREAVLRTTPRIKREWQNQYLRCATVYV